MSSLSLMEGTVSSLGDIPVVQDVIRAKMLINHPTFHELLLFSETKHMESLHVFLVINGGYSEFPWETYQ